MLNWAQDRFGIFAFLNSNGYSDSDSRFDCMLAVAGDCIFESNNDDCYDSLKSFHQIHPGWLFGHIQYPHSQRNNSDFSTSCFFVPAIRIELKKNELFIETDKIDAEEIASEILSIDLNHKWKQNNIALWQPTLSKSNYISRIHQILSHIQRGDCYEMNFCTAFNANTSIESPTDYFQELCQISPNPFAAFYRIRNKYAFCASPERFIQRKGNTVISQPIKGTSKRDLKNVDEDEKIKTTLTQHPKERCENVMIVDLVRNDLSKVATEGSVRVRDLMGLHTFPHVHHLISTIEANVEEQTHWTDILRATFPMGSMTGAPKKRVMELTEKYEESPRGLFSGTIGYITPDGAFDFNVVIRTVFYDATQKQITCKVGSGITIHSNPENEYEECIAKIDAIKKIPVN